MKNIFKGLLSLLVAFSFFMTLNFNVAFAASKGCGLYFNYKKICTSGTVKASSAHKLKVTGSNYNSNNVKLQVIDSKNGKTVFSRTMYNNNDFFSVTLNYVYSTYYVKLTCLERWPWDNECEAYGSISN